MLPQFRSGGEALSGSSEGGPQVSDTDGIDMTRQRFYFHRYRRRRRVSSGDDVDFAPAETRGAPARSSPNVCSTDRSRNPTSPPSTSTGTLRWIRTSSSSPQMVTLYGTSQWDAMSREQQRSSPRQQLVNMFQPASVENILNQALLRASCIPTRRRGPRSTCSPNSGDETRHMVMFGKTIDRVGESRCGPGSISGSSSTRCHSSSAGRSPRGARLWSVKRSSMSCSARSSTTPDLQPIVRRLMRIHVTEEARTSSSPVTACARRRRPCRGTARS